MTLPLSVSGQQFIAGRRVASGEATLPNLRAADGKLTGYHFTRPLGEAAAASRRLTRRFLSIHERRQTCVPTSRHPLPTSWICSARIFAIAHQGEGTAAGAVTGRARPYQ